jgi:tetrahydromethanopterin S-methyltransferase subunit C
MDGTTLVSWLGCEAVLGMRIEELPARIHTQVSGLEVICVRLSQTTTRRRVARAGQGTGIRKDKDGGGRMHSVRQDDTG